MRFAKKVVLEQFTLFCLINNQYTIAPCISSHHSSHQATMYHMHVLQIKGFILAGDQVHGITLKNQISRFRPLKVRPVGGAAVSGKKKLASGTASQPRRKETTATPPIKPKNSHCVSDIRTSVFRPYLSSHVGKKYLFLDCVPTRFVLSLYYSAPLNTSLFIHSTNF